MINMLNIFFQMYDFFYIKSYNNTKKFLHIL